MSNRVNCSSVVAKEPNVWLKDYEDLRPERAAILPNVHKFLQVLSGLWKTSL